MTSVADTMSTMPFGVYVHWPFCLAKCPYCDFNSHVRHRPVDAEAFGAAMVRELEFFRGQTVGRTVTSIFFGGGTPSLMPPAAVARVIDAIAANWSVAANVEITLEANPTSAEARNFEGYRTAGVNRLSVGIQALDDDSLKALGRRHSADEALAAWRLAARLFGRTSFDLIYARPGQTIAAWGAELARALNEAPGHMSLYQLTIESNTPYAALHAAGSLAMPGEDLAADLYDLTSELTAAAGLPAYEVSNHARPGDESRHNLLYWRYDDYLGIGPGAHARILEAGVRRALVNEKHPETWRDQVQRLGRGACEDVALSKAEQASEMLLMGLRLSEGIDPARYAKLAGRPLARERLNELIGLGLLVRHDDGHLTASTPGRRLLNAVIARLES
jgi:putative oxygen-independent coproporphyrinogen III oxidase